MVPMVHFSNFYSLKLFKTKDLSKSVNWWPMHMSIKCSSGKGVVLGGGGRVIPGRSARGNPTKSISTKSTRLSGITHRQVRRVGSTVQYDEI